MTPDQITAAVGAGLLTATTLWGSGYAWGRHRRHQAAESAELAHVHFHLAGIHEAMRTLGLEEEVVRIKREAHAALEQAERTVRWTRAVRTSDVHIAPDIPTEGVGTETEVERNRALAGVG